MERYCAGCHYLIQGPSDYCYHCNPNKMNRQLCVLIERVTRNTQEIAALRKALDDYKESLQYKTPLAMQHSKKYVEKPRSSWSEAERYLHNECGSVPMIEEIDRVFS